MQDQEHVGESRRRDQILDAAGEVFGQYGLRKTTMGDIVRAAGVARATVYRYFGSKDEVFVRVLEREMGDIIEAVRAAVAEESTTRKRLRAAIMTHSEMIRRKINVFRVTMRALADIMGTHRESHLEKIAGDFQGIVASILESGIEAGEIAVDDVELTSRTILYALKGVFMGAAWDVWDEQRPVVVDRLIELLMDGMATGEERA